MPICLREEIEGGASLAEFLVGGSRVTDLPIHRRRLDETPVAEEPALVIELECASQEGASMHRSRGGPGYRRFGMIQGQAGRLDGTRVGHRWVELICVLSYALTGVEAVEELRQPERGVVPEPIDPRNR